MSIRPKPAHQILDIPGKPNISRHEKPKRLKPGPLARLKPEEVRDRCITAALNDQEVEALDRFRNAMPIRPTRSAFLAYVFRDYIERNRRRDLPGIQPRR